MSRLTAGRLPAGGGFGIENCCEARICDYMTSSGWLRTFICSNIFCSRKSLGSMATGWCFFRAFGIPLSCAFLAVRVIILPPWFAKLTFYGFILGLEKAMTSSCARVSLPAGSSRCADILAAAARKLKLPTVAAIFALLVYSMTELRFAAFW